MTEHSTLITERDASDPKSMVIRRAPRKRKSLVLWSGGLSSTWAVWRLLAEDTDEILLHHVHYRSRTADGTKISRLIETEEAAVRRAHQWISETHRPLAYSDSVIDGTGFSNGADTLTNVIFAGAQAAMTWGLQSHDRIVIGAHQITSDALNDQRARLRGILHVNLLKAVMQTEKPPALTPLGLHRSKSAQAQDLAGGLRECVAYCETPMSTSEKKIRPCGQCPSCLAVFSTSKDDVARESDLIH
ncbi:MAG: hypothetical protein AAF557_10150 [Pseudomonadota bacterium]